ncbi:MAG: SMP-30/gluconolactonase/LRE family protein [Anaerolineae bacterium]
MEPEIVADYSCQIGENPLWHPGEQRLYWTDITAGKVFWYEPATGKHQVAYEGEMVGGFTVQADGALLLFMARGAVAIWRQGVFTTVIDEIAEERQSRFNDVIADVEGRVFCGTMPTPERLGRLYRLDTDGSLHLLLEDIGTSNGLGFTPDGRQLYYTDSPNRVIYLFDYDRASGDISNRRVFATAAEGDGLPDGMTVDAEGYVWSARWGGSCLVRYDPAGNEVQRFHFPAKKVSSAIFAGLDYSDIYVTTACQDGREIEGPGAGALFRLRTGVRGVPEFVSRVRLG